MKYTYNYSALGAFLEQNNLDKKDILKALGTKDYATLNSWLAGQVPVHTTAMLKICNYFQIPLETFFFDNDQPVSVRPEHAGENSQQLPVGYVAGQARQRGGGIVETLPTEQELRQSGSPALARVMDEREVRRARWRQELLGENTPLPHPTKNEKTDAPTEDAGTNNDNKNQDMVNQMLQLQLQHVSEIREMEANHAQQMMTLMQTQKEREDQIRRECMQAQADERERLMQVIEKQNSEIVRMHAAGAYTKKTPYATVLNDGNTIDTDDNVICDMSTTASVIR